MYVQKVSLQNIRSIKKLVMEFPNPAGWHVIIGDNGSGKSSILQAISFNILQRDIVLSLKQMSSSLLNIKEQNGLIMLDIHRHDGFDLSLVPNTYDGKTTEQNLASEITQLSIIVTFIRRAHINYYNGKKSSVKTEFLCSDDKENHYQDWGEFGWFSASFGPFRRFSGSNPNTDEVLKSLPRLSAHGSLFGEDLALTETLEWLKEIDYKRLKEQESDGGDKENTIIYDNLIKFINESKLLPHNTTIKGLDKDGIIFKDGNGIELQVLELSDGYRSILSLTFELIRQLVRVYGAQAVFADIEKGKMEINLPGVVLIDEIDAHLHPSWQVDVGFWFTKYFPQLQFIVTTHSPLVCRAAEKGSIWRLAKPGTDSQAEEITGVEKERLIYGNILDAYGTELFGENTVRSKKSKQKLDRLGRLNMLYAIGKIKPEEEKERLKLQKILSTDDPTGF